MGCCLSSEEEEKASAAPGLQRPLMSEDLESSSEFEPVDADAGAAPDARSVSFTDRYKTKLPPSPRGDELALALDSTDTNSSEHPWRTTEAELDAYRLKELFKAIDKNGDKTISRIELILALRKLPELHLAMLLRIPAVVLQEGETRQRFEATFQAMDADGDDRLDWHEFVTHVSRVRAAADGEVYAGSAAAATAAAPAAATAPADTPALAPTDGRELIRKSTERALEARKDSPRSLVGQRVRVFDASDGNPREGLVLAVKSKRGGSTLHEIRFGAGAAGQAQQVLLRKKKGGKGCKFHVLGSDERLLLEESGSGAGSGPGRAGGANAASEAAADAAIASAYRSSDAGTGEGAGESRSPVMVAIDVDGTLLRSDHTLSAGVEAALRVAVAAGVHVVLATGKGPGPWSERLLPRLNLGAPVVMLQGLMRCDDAGRVVRATTMSAALAAETLELAAALLEEFGAAANTFFYCTDRVLCPRLDRHADVFRGYGESEPVVPEEGQSVAECVAAAQIGVHKMVCFCDAGATHAEVQRRLEGALHGEATVVSSVPRAVEVLPPNVTKGAAVAAVAQELGVPAANVVAVGDGRNDLEMIQQAGLGCAMGNACAPVKEAADRVVGTNDEDGVVEVLRLATDGVW
eukprot:g2495.t1